MGGIRISVALCTYNSEEFLSEQLRSIVAQTRAVHEIVISDDGSTDNTKRMVEEFAATDSRVLVAPWERVGGVTRNFERALAMSTGDVILLCDHDDIWKPDKVARLSQEIGQFARAMVFSDAQLIGSGGNDLGVSLFEALRVSTSELRAVAEGRGTEVLTRRNIVTGATACVTQGLVDIARPFPEGWLHDEWLAVIAALVGHLGFLSEPLTAYRQHGSNQIGVGSPSTNARMARMFASNPERHVRASARIEVLLSRARELGAPQSAIQTLERKASFERSLAALPTSRPRRLLPVLKLLRSGAYTAHASQGRLDAVRDLFVT